MIKRKLNKTSTNCPVSANLLKWDLSKSTSKLKELAAVLDSVSGKRLLVLCHNNPDPDTIGGALAFQYLLQKKFGARSIIGYGGMVTRAENKAMISRLRIKIYQLSKVDITKYHGIALIDAQPGTGNNLLDVRGAVPLIVVDHHPLKNSSCKAAFHDVRPRYGATSTIIAEYLVAAGLTPTRSVANALLYGIKADTNALIRGCTKVDFNAFNYLSPLSNHRVIGWIERPSLSLEHFEDFQRGLARTKVYKDVAVSYLGKIYTEAIIPELADLLLRMEGVSWSFCMGENNGLMVLSIRSTSRVHKAGTVIRRLVGKYGSAGGHKEMAGAQVSLAGMSDDEKTELPDKLMKKFMKLINREPVNPRLIAPDSQNCVHPIVQ